MLVTDPLRPKQMVSDNHRWQQPQFMKSVASRNKNLYYFLWLLNSLWSCFLHTFPQNLALLLMFSFLLVETKDLHKEFQVIQIQLLNIPHWGYLKYWWVLPWSCIYPFFMYGQTIMNKSSKEDILCWFGCVEVCVCFGNIHWIPVMSQALCLCLRYNREHERPGSCLQR